MPSDYASIMQAHGFTEYKRCTACSGTLEVKYQSGHYRVFIKPNKNSFKIVHNGIRRSSGNLDGLETAMQLNQI